MNLFEPFRGIREPVRTFLVAPEPEPEPALAVHMNLNLGPWAPGPGAPREPTKQNKTKRGGSEFRRFLRIPEGRVLFCFVLGKNFWTDFGALPQPLAARDHSAPLTCIPTVWGPTVWGPTGLGAYSLGAYSLRATDFGSRAAVTRA